MAKIATPGYMLTQVHACFATAHGRSLFHIWGTGVAQCIVTRLRARRPRNSGWIPVRDQKSLHQSVKTSYSAQ